MKYILIIVAVWLSIGTVNSLPYPIFGTKRYHRGASPRTGMAQHILRQPVYEDGYITSNGYYYYPHHEYHSYGMPTYRGEYKPKAYYYSAGPSYNYYNDREPASNPLDDLHEEILQENEQERQTDILGDNDYDDDYYIDPSETSHDIYRNNFLRNMMEYNRQKEKHQQLQLAQQQQQREHLIEDIQGEEERPTDDDYFSEIEVNPDDYQFEPKGEDSFDLQKYWDAEMSSLAKSGATSSLHHQQDAAVGTNNDEDVEELKSLTKHESDVDDEDYRKRYHTKGTQGQFPHLNNWRQPQASESNLPRQKEHEEDYTMDYDDGSWINWDRKRSSLPEKTDKFLSEFKLHKRLLAEPKKLSSQTKDTVMSTRAPVKIFKTAGQKEQYSAGAASTKSNQSADNKQKINSITSGKEHSKSPLAIEQSIYDTIKQMISIEQELKKTGSKKRKRYVPDDGNLVTQLEGLRRPNN